MAGVKAVLALLCCLALLAGPAVALGGLATDAPAGCCHAGNPPCGHDTAGGGHGHDQNESAPTAGCAAFCAASCCVAVLSVDFMIEEPALTDFTWHDFFATGARRADCPPLPPPRGEVAA